jgi:hypothetical protein
MNAPDVAITEASVGAGLSTVCTLAALSLIKNHTVNLCHSPTTFKGTGLPVARLRNFISISNNFIRFRMLKFRFACVFVFDFKFIILNIWGALLVAQLVEALRYKPEGRGFDSRWCHWKFSLT